MLKGFAFNESFQFHYSIVYRYISSIVVFHFIVVFWIDVFAKGARMGNPLHSFFA